MAYLYSELIMRFKEKLEEQGLHEVPSMYLREKGDTVFPDAAVTENLLASVLEIEINGRRLIKREMEEEVARSQRALEKNREDIINMQLEAEIKKLFPADKIQEEFTSLYPGVIAGTVRELKKQGKFSLDENHKLVLGEVQERSHPENMNELERLLYDAKVTRFSRHESGIEDAVYNAVKAQGSDRFFNYFVR